MLHGPAAKRLFRGAFTLSADRANTSFGRLSRIRRLSSLWALHEKPAFQESRMTTRTRHAYFQPCALAVAVALGGIAPAQAVTFNIGEIEGEFDSSLSVGASWSTQGADPDLIGTIKKKKTKTPTKKKNPQKKKKKNFFEDLQKYS